jgi:cell division septation protein DedD
VTCVNLVEQSSVNLSIPELSTDAFQQAVNSIDPSTTNIVVGHFSQGCWATNVGPSENMAALINLGSCFTDRHIGNMVHEVGHVLGMNHKQQRPDAQAEYFGHGPYLQMHWDNVQATSQWLPDLSSYTGSGNDGLGDPHSGYAPYDFGSIMHYGVDSEATTIPPGQLTGQRKALSQSDINQMNDQYQCRRRTEEPTATPTEEPTPATPTQQPTPMPTAAPTGDPTPTPTVTSEVAPVSARSSGAFIGLVALVACITM